MNEIIKALCDVFMLKKITTTAYHPNSNGFVERIHQFYKNTMKAYAEDGNKDWDSFLALLVMTYNDSKHTSTGFTPFFLSTGRDFRLPTDYVQEGIDEENMSINSYAENLSRMLALARERVNEVAFKLSNKLADNQAGKILIQTEFEEEDQVMLFIPATKPGMSRALVRRWVGPFWVLTLEEVLSESVRATGRYWSRGEDESQCPEVEEL